MAQTTVSSNIQPQTERTAGSENYTWRTLLSNALIITRREVRDSLRDWRILTPIHHPHVWLPVFGDLRCRPVL